MKAVVILLLAASALVTWAVLAYRSTSGEFTQADVDRISTACNAAPQAITFRRGQIVIAEPTNGDTVGECVLRELRESGKKSYSIVGNALYITDGDK